MVDYQTISIVLTGIGMIIALTYYGLQIRNQNRTRQAQLFMQTYNRWTQPDFIDALMWLRTQEKWTNFDDHNEAMNDITNSRNTLLFVTYFEGVGVLVKEGLIDIRLVAELMTGIVTQFWDKYALIIDEGRRRLGYPRWFSETEYLYKELIRYEKTHPEIEV
jgi:hypothetical protein